MSDTRIRELARQAAQGDAEAEVTLLRERMRTGQLERERVRLAADCRHEPARLAFPGWWTEAWTCEPEPGEIGTFDAFIYHLSLFEKEPWGLKMMVRIALAAAWQAYCTLPCVGAPHKTIGLRRYYKSGIEPCGAGEWDLCTCSRQRKAITAARCWVDNPSAAAITLAITAGRSLIETSARVELAPCIVGPARMLQGDKRGWESSIIMCAHVTSEKEVRESIERYLIPWVLEA